MDISPPGYDHFSAPVPRTWGPVLRNSELVSALSEAAILFHWSLPFYRRTRLRSRVKSQNSSGSSARECRGSSPLFFDISCGRFQYLRVLVLVVRHVCGWLRCCNRQTGSPISTSSSPYRLPSNVVSHRSLRPGHDFTRTKRKGRAESSTCRCDLPIYTGREGAERRTRRLSSHVRGREKQRRTREQSPRKKI